MKNQNEQSVSRKSIWQESVKLPEFPQLKGDVKTDVLVIGGGITGLLTAYFLQQRGVPYILVEKGRICGGTTGFTTAKITVQHGLIYDRLFRSGGAERAQMYLHANQSALNKFAEMSREIECDFERRDNFVYSADDRKALERELTALQKIGCDAKLCERLPLPLKTVGAVRVDGQAQFDPLKFLAAIAKNLNIYENTPVREMVGTTAVTPHGKIHAKQVVVATHFPFINKHGSYYLKLYQHRSYVLALENAADVGGMYVDESKTGLSFRNLGRYLLLGGAGHRTGKNGCAWEELKRLARLYYPVSRVRYEWAAQDCMSLDGVPYIGQYSANTPGLLAASGFNKWGMTGSMLAATLLTEKICGERSEYDEIFSPSRSILKPQLMVNGFEAVKNLLTPTEKRCPHLGCALKWNKAERSWDCACHGSRFDARGKVLDNPANGDLK